MADTHVVGNWAKVNHPRNTMSAFGLAVISTRIDDTISEVARGTSPQPTSIRLLDVLPEALFNGARCIFAIVSLLEAVAGRLTTAAFAKFRGMIGVHGKLPFLCQAQDAANVAGHFLLVCYRSNYIMSDLMEQ